MYTRAATVAGLLLGYGLAGCGSAAVPPPRPTPAPIPTATVSVGFVVQVTPVPTRPPRATPRARPTPFRPPRGRPYIVLEPNTGPPASQTITVRGGGLPASASVALVWTTSGRGAGVGTTTGTTRRGALAARFTIPASPPGFYDVIAEVNGVPLASARYTVASTANLVATMQGAPGHETLAIHGVHFLPRLHIVLIAYAAGNRMRAIYIGGAETTSSGKLSYARREQLPPGQYILRAWSASAMSSQMAETVFQVVF